MGGVGKWVAVLGGMGHFSVLQVKANDKKGDA